MASVRLSVPIRYVTIKPVESKSWGHVLPGKIHFAKEGVFDDSLRGMDRAERYIIVCYAGPLCSRKLQPKCRWRLMGGSDFDQAAEIFMRICGEDAKAQLLYDKLLWRRAELLVQHQWKNITAVANALLERQKLDRDEIKQVILDAHGIKPFKLGEAAA